MVKEGKAEVLLPDHKVVFYNPVQELNRDLRTAGIQACAALNMDVVNHEPGKVCDDGVTVLEALAANRTRCIGFAKERVENTCAHQEKGAQEEAEQVGPDLEHDCAHDGRGEVYVRIARQTQDLVISTTIKQITALPALEPVPGQPMSSHQTRSPLPPPQSGLPSSTPIQRSPLPLPALGWHIRDRVHDSKSAPG